MKLYIAAIFWTFVVANLSAQQIGDGYAPATITNFSAPLKSGVYNGLNTTTVGMAPDNSNVWQHLFVARHIGTTNNYQLQITSSFAVNDRLFFRKIVAGDLSPSNTNWVELATRGVNNFEGNQSINGNLGIGTATPSSPLYIKSSNDAIIGLQTTDDRWLYMPYYNSSGIRKSWVGLGYDLNSFNITVENGADKILLNGGNVGIGVSNPLNKLDVNGTIHSKEVKVDMNGWADFVFKNEYQLSTLQEVEKHIIEKGHLKNIPNEKQVLENGINLGEMNAKLLQKIEELTLYVIEQNKQITDLQNRLVKIESTSN